MTHISQAADGGVWITHYHTGIEHYNKQTKQLTWYTNKDIKELKTYNSCSLDDGNGNLLIGHLLDGLSVLDLNTKTVRNLRHNSEDPSSLPDNSVRCIYKDRFNNIWVGTYQGLALFDPRTDSFISFRHNPNDNFSLGSNSINSICEMKDGTLWLSTDMAGLSILNLSQFTFHNPEIKFQNIIAGKPSNNLSSANVSCIFQDSFENVWIGHHRQGLNFISKNQQLFQTLPYHAGIISGKPLQKLVWSICRGKNQQIWIGGENELSLFQNGELKKSIDMNKYILPINRYINSMKYDSKGFLWLGIYQGGVIKFNPKTMRAENIASQLLHNMSVRNFFEDTDGKIWISTEAGLYSYDNNSFRYEEKINNQLKDKVIYCFIRDRENQIWIGTFGEGLHIFDPEGNLKDVLSTYNGFCSNAINDLYIDSHNNMWVGTRNGLVYMKDINNYSEYTLYDDKNSLANSHIRSIQEDHNGDIWVSTNIGISHLDKKKNVFYNFNYQDGTPFGNFLNGASCADSDGNIFFASLNGACYFNPAKIGNVNRVTPVEIISIHGFLQNNEIQQEEYIIPFEEGTVNLPYDRNSFSISFAVPNYAQSGQIEYAYSMRGLEKAWYNITDQNQLTFRNISPGNYTFQVKARLKNHDWDEITLAALPIHIHPPVWLTWYAKLLYFIIACLIGYTILRSYKRRLKLQTSLELEKRNSQNKQELNEERLRFYTNVTHELRTPLTLILGPLEDLLTDVNLPQAFKNKIDIIYVSATKLLNLINQLLEFRKTETQNKKLTVAKGNLADLIMETGLRYKELNTNEKVTITISIETDNTILFFDPEVIGTILNNLLSNALKYTPSGEIKLTMRNIRVNDNIYTEVGVSDTGYGIESGDLPYIFDRYYQAKGKHQASGTGIGLSLVKSLVELHEGDVSVNSLVGNGSCFTFRLLNDNTYPSALHADNQPILKETVSILNITEIEDRQDELPIVLVIEDNTDIREYIASSLSDTFQVITANNGKEGFEQAEVIIPNIIVSDIMMPEMDGIEFCRLIKGDVRTSHIPVILLTAKESIQDKEEGYESGADSYLTKPFSAKLLRSRILNLLDSRKKIAAQLMSQRQDDVKDTSIEMNRLDRDFLDKFTQLIEENLQKEKLDVDFLKDKMNMSSSTLYRKLKALTGLSPKEFVRKYRMDKAVELLLSGEYNVSETAYITGFSDSGYFRFCFKEEYGMSPSEYIKKRKNG